MYQRIVLFICLLFYALSALAQNKQDSFVTQTIVYKTDKAQEVYMAWAVDNWALPDSSFWPAQSLARKKMVWTKMNKEQSSFSLSLTLPAKTYTNFMFWVPVDANGDSTDGWDTYGDIFYSTDFSKNDRIEIDDNALWIPDKQFKMDLLKSGKSVFLFTIGICLLLLLPFVRRLSFSYVALLTGLFTGAVLLTALVRMEMNHLFFRHLPQTPGAMFQDLVFLVIVSLVFAGLLYLTKKKRWLSATVASVFCIVLLTYCLYDILNIEIVRQLGRPLNYQWLYYSDFMRGADAKNAVAYSLSKELVTNVILLLLSVTLFSVAFSFLPRPALRSINLGLSAVLLLIIVTAFVEKRTINYEEKNVVNPIAELISSTYSSNNTPKLFAMSIPESTKEYMTGIHSASDEGEISPISGISNIVLFVMESTPASVIGLYNDSITVTPNLKKWRSISTRYNNMYAHMPSTPNSMLSMVAGIYPKLSFRSLLQDTLSDKMVTIPNELLKKNWTTSFFSSADLRFGNMDSFARKSGFETIGDSKTIDCSFDKFRITNSSLDGLDDRCIAQQYLRWTDDHKKQHKFSMLWTNQTHQPYFFDRDKEVQYSKNGELNHYLNAIKYSDEAFGILMEGLQRRGMLNNTVVIVVGDHGEAFGSHDQFNHGSHIYDENVHIPGIVYSPVLCKGGTDDRVAGLIDLPPTIGAIAGIKKSDFWQGRSLFSKQERKEAFYICPYSDFLCGLRDGKWKYIYNATTNTSELYDLEKDPLETNNVASKNRDIVKKEYELLGAWVQYQNKRIEDLKSTPKSAAPAATASNK